MSVIDDWKAKHPDFDVFVFNSPLFIGEQLIENADGMCVIMRDRKAVVTVDHKLGSLPEAEQIATLKEILENQQKRLLDSLIEGGKIDGL